MTRTGVQRRSTWRRVDGILLLDKPSGISSNAALQQARRLFSAAKAGHTGSLDPLASGLLPICFGEATKLSGLLLDSDKRYEVVLQLGAQTDTADADGAVVATAPFEQVTAEAIEAAVLKFTGEQRQVPPMYSALKHQGQRLYALARQGLDVERAPRDITIHALRVLSFGGGQLELHVHCSKGTYIRSLGEDLARALGTLAHVVRLRRVAAGPFTGPMLSLETLQTQADAGGEALDHLLLPPSAALRGWPELRLDAEASRRLRLGQAVRIPGIVPPGELALYGPTGELIGIGKALADGRVAPSRLLAEPATPIPSDPTT